MMNFTAGKRRASGLVLACALLVWLLVGIYVIALSEQPTTLTVQVKGVTYDGTGGWRSITLSVPINVLSSDGSLLGQVNAGALLGEAQSDTLTLEGADEVILRPAVENATEGFIFADESRAVIVQGENNLATVFAYASQGLFSVQNLMAETGALIAGAEFAVLDSAGAVQDSFTIDASGFYQSAKPLPEGKYKLVQMRAAANTLPIIEPVPFTISPYFGRDEDITALLVQSQPIPSLSASVGKLKLSLGTFAADANGGLEARLTVRDLCNGENNLELNDVSMTLTVNGLGDTRGNLLAGVGKLELRWLMPQNSTESRISAQGYNEAGAAVGDPITLTDGQANALPEGVCKVTLCYLNPKNGENTLPVGFQAGSIEAGVRYLPEMAAEGAQRPAFGLVSAKSDMSYQYTDVDGVSAVHTPVQTEAVSGRVVMPDGRLDWKLSATASGNAITFKGEQLPAGLPSDTLVALVLPEGARVDEAQTAFTHLLRERSNDVVVTTAGELTAGYAIAISHGDVTEMEALVRDPGGLPATESNPNGALLMAEDYREAPLLDTLFGSRGEAYAYQPLPLSGEVHQAKTVSYSFEAASGKVISDKENADASCGVVLKRQDSNISYGAATGEAGEYTVYLPPDPTSQNQSATLECLLPENALARDTGGAGLFSKELTLPVTDCHIVYMSMCELSGQVTLASGAAVVGILVRLLSGEEVVREGVTDASGAFRFQELAKGEYKLVLSSAEMEGVRFVRQPGLEVKDGEASMLFTLSGEEEQTFKFQAARACTMSGTLTDDGTPVANATVVVISASGERMESITGADGRYAFANLNSGELKYTVSPPEGWAVMTVGDQKVSAIGEYASSLVLSEGDALVLDIVLVKASTIIGSASAVGGGKTVSAASSYAHASAETASDGSFQIDRLPAGEYSVYVPLPEGWAVAADSAWRVTQRGDMVWITVSVAQGGKYALPELLLSTVTSIEGCAYVDANGNLVRDADEQLMTGVSVALQKKAADGWTDVANTKTDAFGKYQFDDLGVGDYRVASKTDALDLYVASVGSTIQSLGESGVVCSNIIALREGSHSKDEANIGLQTPSELRLIAFHDKNGDGQKNEKERAIGGVTAEVISAEASIASGTTDAAGEMSIAGIRPGKHRLRITLPDGYAYTTVGESLEEQSVVESADGRAVQSMELAFVGGQAATAHVGAKPVGSLGGKVFEDINNNGVMDEGEPGVPGISLHLKGQKTGGAYEFTTGESGEYRFGNLPNDTYALSATLPEGMLYARYSKTGGNLRSIFSGSTTVREFPVSNAENVSDKNIGVIEKGVIAGKVFLDTNYNGVFDEGEPGFKGVTLEVIKISNSESMGKAVSGSDGSYLIEGLRGGEYRLRAILPDDGTIFTVVPQDREGAVNLFEQRGARRENTIQPITIESGGAADTLVGVAVGATVSGKVFLDADYNGSLNGKEKPLSGLKVRLVDAAGNIIVTTTTNAEGKYSLTGIMPGAYTVQVQRKAGHGFTRLRPDEKGGSHVTVLEGEFGVTAAMDIAMGEKIENISAGMLPSSTVTGIFFHDANDNGVIDAEERGMEGASVRLLSEDGEIDLVRQIAEDGAYFFDGVMPGKYTLTYSLPEHVELARVTANGNTLQHAGMETTTSPFQVEMGGAFQCPLVGAVTLGSFSGFVFHDVNANGIADDGEERMAGATVALAQTNAQSEAQTVSTEADGSFQITGLRPGEYQLTVKLPGGYVFSYDLAADGIMLDTVQEQTVGCSWRVLTNRREQAIGAVKPATVSGILWLDENKDGVQGGGELLMAGVGMELVNESTSQVVKRTTTNEQGFSFANVRPGTYTVRFALPNQSQPAADSQSTFVLDGAFMADSGIAVKEGEAASGLSAGLVSLTSIGGRLWLEENGERSAVANATVMLFAGGANEPLGTAVTGEDGAYQFDGLWPGDYYLQAEMPSGMVFVRPDDPNYQQGASAITASGDGVGTSELFYLQMAQHQLEENIIYIKPAHLGDIAWLDLNKNGLVDGGEPMIPGVKISLMQNGQEAYQTVTNAYGYYLFEDVYPGEYTLQAAAYPAFGITKSIAELRIISSCLTSGDGESAQSDSFEVASGSANHNFDLGYVLLEGQPMPEEMAGPPAKDWSKPIQ